MTKNTLRGDTRRKIPIARCANPSCGCTILYGADPKQKANVTVRVAAPEYTGLTYLCPRCKTMLSVIEKPKATGVVAVPIVQEIFIQNRK